MLALLDVVTGSLGQNKQTAEQDDSPSELNSDRNAVTSSVLTFLGGVTNDGCKQKTNGDCQLLHIFSSDQTMIL